MFVIWDTLNPYDDDDDDDIVMGKVNGV